MCDEIVQSSTRVIPTTTMNKNHLATYNNNIEFELDLGEIYFE